MKKYYLKTKNWLLSDIKGVRFHVKSSDYFGTLAAILSIIEEKIDTINDKREKIVIKKTLKNLIDDCQYLQKNYSIIAKKKKKNNKPNGNEKTQ